MKLKVFLALLGIFIAALLLVGFYIPQLSLTVSASPTLFGQAGDVIKYTYVITNIGDRHLDGIKLVDGSTLVPCLKDALDSGDSMICTRNYTVNEADVKALQVEATATVTGWYSSNGACGSTSKKAEASASTSITWAPAVNNTRPSMYFGRANLLLTKSTNLASYDHVGQLITYTYTVTNGGGNSSFIDPITITDDLAEVECPDLPASGLMPGASLTCIATYSVTPDDMNSGTITNTATVYSGQAQFQTVTLEIPVAAMPSLGLTKTANPASYMYPGESILFTLTITNDGNVPLSGPPAISDSMLKNWTCLPAGVAELAPDEIITCTATLVISDTASGNSFTNNATVSMKYGDKDVSNTASAVVRALPTPVPPVRVLNCSLLTEADCVNHSDICILNEDKTCSPINP